MTDPDQIPAGISYEFHAIYEVAADARGLRLKVEAFSDSRPQEGFIGLGM